MSRWNETWLKGWEVLETLSWDVEAGMEELRGGISPGGARRGGERVGIRDGVMGCGEWL